LEVLGTEATAFTAITYVLNHTVNGPMKFTTLAVLLGRVLARESALVAEQAESDEKDPLARFLKVGSNRRRIEVHKLDKMLQLNHEKNQDDVASAGAQVIDVLVNSTDLLEYADEPVRVGQQMHRARTLQVPEARRAQIEEHIAHILDNPNAIGHWPMVVPPRCWSNSRKGGYLTRPARLNYSFAGRRWSVCQGDTHDERVYRAINAVQDTAFRVNKDVLRVAKEFVEKGIDGPGLTRPKSIQFPERPPEDLKPGTQAHKATWMQYYTELDWCREQYDEAEGNWRLSHAAISLADRMKDYGAIYFPYKLDFRGRMYPLVNALQPQGSKLGAGLIELAHGKAIGDEGLYWLKVYAANTFGKDKLPYEDRVAWTEANSDLLCRIARDPVGTLDEWKGADKPYHFLQCCLEWPSVVENGPEHVSHISVQMDGTCNGLQHLSALSWDSKTAKLVNVLDGDRPADVYRTVAEALEASIKATMKGRRCADRAQYEYWVKQGIDRSLVKKPVMTLPYGSTQYGQREALRDAMADKGWSPDSYPIIKAAKGRPERRMSQFELIAAVNGLLWDAIGETIPGARQTMDWLQGSVVAANKAGMGVSWKTPDGFVVHQEYHEKYFRHVTVITSGARIRMSVQDNTPDLNKTKQRSAIAPNFIHSLDACAMRMYVNKGIDAGLTAFAMIHDSFGTHAADVGTMQQLLREAFLEMYQANPAGGLLESLAEQGTPYEEPLPTGDLHISDVLKSRYFFA
jgi:DNA-directed RNA polymerase